MKKLVNNSFKKSVDRLKKLTLWEIGLLFLVSFVILFYFGWGMDVDSWFILNVGRYIYTNGFPYVEPFTIHEGLSYVAQQWGYAVILWPLYKNVGAIGIFILNIFLYLVLVRCLYALCMFVSEKNKKVSFFVTSVICIILCYQHFITLRPQMFTYIFLTLFLLIMENYLKNGKKKNLFWLLPLSILQINFHAAMWWMQFIFALPFLAEILINKIVNKEKSIVDIRPLLIALILAFFSGIINPYGIDAITYFPSSFDPFVSKLVIEMQATSLLSVSGLLLLGILIIHFFIYMKKYSSFKDIKFSYFFLLFGTFILAINTVKCQILFFIAALYPMAYFFKDFFIKEKSLSFKSYTLKYKCFYIFILLLLVIASGYFLYYRVDFSGKNSAKEDVLFLKDLYGTEDIVLYAGYNIGSYAEYEGFRSYIDSRAEVFYNTINKKEEIFDEYYFLQNGKMPYQQFLDKYQFTHLLIYLDDVLYYYEDIENYHIIYEKDACRIYERDDFQKDNIEISS